MTTDPFTTAAHAESERLVAASPTGRVLPTPHGVAIAEWARTYLAEQEASETEAGAARKLRKIRKLNDRYSLGGMVPCDEIDKVLDPDYAGALEAPAARAVGRDAR